MAQLHSTTLFGRPLSLAHVEAQAGASTWLQDKAVTGELVSRDICAGRRLINVSERSTAVLDALLTFIRRRR